MKTFHCDHCQHLLFFENSLCVQCGSRQAYIPEATTIASLPPESVSTWEPRLPGLPTRTYHLCENYVDHAICNWAVADEDHHPLCRSCRLTRVIPDVSQEGALARWYRLEVAKRRLIFTLFALGVPLPDRDHDPDNGLAFEFKSDPADPAEPRVLTGHADGVITINLAEADDAERERRRQDLGEPFRTVLGHMRHESGHFFWDQLIKDTGEIEEFRALFGDEQRDYAAALAEYYQHGAPADWQERMVSAYASAHPWEDWAETWAHYLHMVDTLETAAATGMSLTPPRAGDPSLKKAPSEPASGEVPFDLMIESWHPITYVLNNLNRGLGLADGYPFVLSAAAIEKLRFVNEVIERKK